MATPEICFLHTSAVHIATFDGLRDRIAPHLQLRHIVREDLLRLALAQGGITADVEAATLDALRGAIAPGAKILICTCSTLGPVAETLDPDAAIPVMRIDRPMADQAVLQAKHIAVCGALSTALTATLALVWSSAEYMDRRITVTDHLFASAWKFFERGDMAGYHREVARGLRGAAVTADLILLAQASMEGALAHCGDLGVPVWSSPETGFRAAMALL